jgi:tetratricopeptide (TPR) repeat protein
MKGWRWLPVILSLPLPAQPQAEVHPPAVEQRIAVLDLAACIRLLALEGTRSPQDLSLDARIAEHRTRQDWAAIRDLINSLPAQDRARRLGTLLEAYDRLEDWKPLIPAADEALALLDRRNGPRPGEPRTLRAKALARSGRHLDAGKAHLENGFLGWEPGFLLACNEAREAADWTFLNHAAEAGLLMHPNRALFLQVKGEALAKMRRCLEAASAWQEALAISPDNPEAWLNLASCQSELKRYREAEEAASQAIQWAPQGLNAYLFRAQLRGYLKQFVKAQEDYRMALSLVPQDPVMQQQIQDALASLERYSARGKR